MDQIASYQKYWDAYFDGDLGHRRRAKVLAWVKDLIDQVIAQEFNAPDLEFSFGAEDSVDPQTQETILSSYTSKGILTINEARAALGRDPLADPAANKPMALTGNLGLRGIS